MFACLYSGHLTIRRSSSGCRPRSGIPYRHSAAGDHCERRIPRSDEVGATQLIAADTSVSKPVCGSISPRRQAIEARAMGADVVPAGEYDSISGVLYVHVYTRLS